MNLDPSTNLDRTMSPTDPRWVMAVRAFESLRMRPLNETDRQRLRQLGRAMGLCEGSTHSIITLAEEHARGGLCLADAYPAVAAVSRTQRPMFRNRVAWVIWLVWIGLVIVALARF